MLRSEEINGRLGFSLSANLNQWEARFLDGFDFFWELMGWEAWSLSDGKKPVFDGILYFWGNNYLINIQKKKFSLNSMGFFLYLME